MSREFFTPSDFFDPNINLDALAHPVTPAEAPQTRESIERELIGLVANLAECVRDLTLRLGNLESHLTTKGARQ